MLKVLQIAGIAVTALFLSAVVTLLVAEGSWNEPEPTSPQDYFLHGSIGTEVMPLAVFQVLPVLFPDQFQPAGPAAGDWVDQFGFVRGTPNINDGLPFGINVSRYRPKSGAPSPIPFIGFNCAICHVSTVLRPDGKREVVYGMGNASLNLVAFGGAVQTALLDEKRLTVSSIASAYESVNHAQLGLLDRLFIAVWLQGARQAIRADFPMRGTPFSGADLRNAALMPIGPGREDAIEETIRFLLDETPIPTGGASKIPSLYEQERREWEEYDGSVRDPLTRNSLAALGVGATVQSLSRPGILHTIEQAYTFVKTLAAPRYTDVNAGDGAVIDQARAGRGQVVYQQYCAGCHGSPDGNQWAKGPRQGQVIPVSEIGTDSARVSFRYYDALAQIIYNIFPDGNPLKPHLEDMRALPVVQRGYITEPLEGAFTRAPYLHNGSVPNLAQLINLEPRPAVFYRGRAEFDPVGVGILAPNQPDQNRYFRYDASAPGNSNNGHDYPWAYHGPGWDEEALKDLLEYLKTL